MKLAFHAFLVPFVNDDVFMLRRIGCFKSDADALLQLIHAAEDKRIIQNAAVDVEVSDLAIPSPGLSESLMHLADFRFQIHGQRRNDEETAASHVEEVLL